MLLKSQFIVSNSFALFYQHNQLIPQQNKYKKVFTTVLIFLFPLDALKRHLLSPSCSTEVSLLVFFDPLGFGFVCPLSIKAFIFIHSIFIHRKTYIVVFPLTSSSFNIQYSSYIHLHFFNVILTDPALLDFWSRYVSWVRNYNTTTQISTP